MEGVSDLAYEFYYCVGIEVNDILKKSGHLVQCHHDFFTWAFRMTGFIMNSDICIYRVCGVWSGYGLSLNDTRI